MELPQFVYHPDPVGTGSVVTSGEPCGLCGQSRGWLYTGPVYAEQELENPLCPWCIADGRAHEELGAEFVDPEAVGGYGEWEPLPEVVVEQVAFRTPSFSGWQQERWFTHCGDAAVFLGAAGASELQGFGPEAMDAIAVECGLEGDELSKYLQSLDRDTGPTAYLFRCRHCGRWGGYSDMS